MNAIKTLLPLYLTARKCPQEFERNAHQALALIIYDDIKKRKLNLENYMYFQEWYSTQDYCHRSAIQVALKIRRYLCLREKQKRYNVEYGRFWQRVKLGFVLYNISHQSIHIDDVLNYVCYLFVTTKCGNKEDFMAFLQTVYQKPELYFQT